MLQMIIEHPIHKRLHPCLWGAPVPLTESDQAGRPRGVAAREPLLALLIQSMMTTSVL